MGRIHISATGQRSPVNPEVFLLHILDHQAVPLHLVLLPGHHRLGVVFCIVRCHRPRECAFLATLAGQRPILAHLGFYKYRTLLLLAQHKTWSNQFTSVKDWLLYAQVVIMKHMSIISTFTSARPTPRITATKSSLYPPLILNQKNLKLTCEKLL